MTALFFSQLAAIFGLLYAAWCTLWILRQDEGGADLGPSYLAIREGANAFIQTQYLTILFVGFLLLIILWVAPQFGFLTTLGFAIGGLCSAFSGIAGMWISVRANVRTTEAAQQGTQLALKVSLRSGAVTGFLVGALALASVSCFYSLLYWLNDSGPIDLKPLVGLGFGASLVSIFARLSGGIFTKAADVGADLVGKIEQSLPEDDPRNPAVIADNVGDNVGDCAGMAADLFESYAVTLVAIILVAREIAPNDVVMQYYPLALGGVGLLAGMLGVQIVHISHRPNIIRVISSIMIVTMMLAAIGFYVVTTAFATDTPLFSTDILFFSTLAGLGLALILVISTIYFTNDSFKPVQRIVRASSSGHATNIITGLAVGMKSTLVPTLAVVAGIMAAYALAGTYGIALAACSMLSLTPIIVMVDAYGPVTDNAGGIAEMSQQPDSVRNSTDALDAVGNTTKAITKAFAIGSAGLAALVLFSVYALELGASYDFAINSPYTLSGLFIGALLPFFFAGMILDAVGSVAETVVAEVRSQFKRNPKILSGEQTPDYAHTVNLLTRASLRGMAVPSLIPVGVPLLITLIWVPLGPEGTAVQLLGGTLIGSIICGYMMAISMCTGGAAWDNAKKYIEAGHEGGKGSSAHMAAITGDTVGDPYKDTAGPAFNPMIKVLNLVALLLVPFL